jgi:anti-sigma factor RsiW
MKRAACITAHDLLDRQWDGAVLAQEEQEALASHLAECSACATRSLEMETLLSVAQDLKEIRYERPLWLMIEFGPGSA